MRGDPCTSEDGKPKRAYRSEDVAWFAADALGMGIMDRAPVHQMPYECPKCHAWHLTTCRTDKQLRKRRRGVIAMRARLARKSRK